MGNTIEKLMAAVISTVMMGLTGIAGVLAGSCAAIAGLGAVGLFLVVIVILGGLCVGPIALLMLLV